MASADRLSKARKVEQKFKKSGSDIVPIPLTYLARDISELQTSTRIIIPKDDDERATTASHVKEQLGSKYQALRQNLHAADVTERQAVKYLGRVLIKRQGESSPRKIANFFARDVFTLIR